jgi:hypothetical protein
MTRDWPRLPEFRDWQETCDTLHGHTQILGKMSAALAPKEASFGHLALRLTARGWETRPLPYPDDTGCFVVALDLRTHEAVVEHSTGHEDRISLTPHRSVGAVTRDLLAAIRARLGADIPFDPTPNEVPWDTPLDADDDHATYDTDAISTYFFAATRATIALERVRAGHPGHTSPVNAWWGSFDVAVSLVMAATDTRPFEREVAVGWWPGDTKYPHPAFYGYISPAIDGLADADLGVRLGRWEPRLGEFILDVADLRVEENPSGAVADFVDAICRLAQMD